MKLYGFGPTRSLRALWGLKELGVEFEFIPVNLQAGAHKRPEFLAINPAGKVPVLIDGDRHIWESLAIIEYVAEKFPEAKVWPMDAAARAYARVLSAEMHAGFAPLRRHCAMNMARRLLPLQPCRQRHHRLHIGARILADLDVIGMKA